MKKIFLITIFLLINGCGNRDSVEPASRSDQEKVTVSVVPVQKIEMERKVRLFGDIQPYYQVDIFAKVGGLITKENTETGQTVTEGEILAEVTQDIPGMEYSPVEIKATRSGTLTMDIVERGSRISPQQKLYTIQELDKVYLLTRVIESVIREAEKGMTVTVMADAYPEKQFRGIISEIYPTVDPVSRMGELKILISNPGHFLKPGMFARTELLTDRHEALAVPLDAIIRRGANTYVFKIEDDRAMQVKVETGISENGMIEIRNTLQAGDQVVILGQNLLDDGTPVQTTEAE